jgi:hypothetical protein
MLAAIPSKSDDPAEIVAEQDERERREAAGLEDAEAIEPIEVLRYRWMDGADF